MRLQRATGPLLWMAFLTTLRKSVKEWFDSLPRISITSFRELACVFSNQFASIKKRKKDRDSLLTVTKMKGEGLMEYIHHFNTKHLEVGTCSNNVAMVAFMAGLGKKTNKPPLRSLYLNPLGDLDSTLAKAKDYILAGKALNSSMEEHKLPKKPLKRAKEEEPLHNHFQV